VQVIAHSREGQILTSIPGIGATHAAAIIASIGNIANFEHAAQLKSYFGWAPQVTQSGSTLDHSRLSRRGHRQMKQTMYLVVWQAIRVKESHWQTMYERLVPIKCRFNEKTREYTGRNTVIGRIAGQMTSVVFALLKADQEAVSKTPAGRTLPDPLLYAPEIHRQHRSGHYHAAPQDEPPTLLHLPVP
jgi:hypothetical protein